jgi:predicted unusual protein kinase regulating ubiquinone biosynthesis (AarF/ABC1/UbiB family)
VDAVGGFSDFEAMNIMRKELADLLPRLKNAELLAAKKKPKKMPKLQNLLETDPILSLFEFYNDGVSVASASIGQVYKARIKRGPALEAAIGPVAAAQWGW